MNKYRDYDNYLKEYPSEDGYFGRYGGNYLEDPELIKAFNEYAEHFAECVKNADYPLEAVDTFDDCSGCSYKSICRTNYTIAGRAK